MGTFSTTTDELEIDLIHGMDFLAIDMASAKKEWVSPQDMNITTIKLTAPFVLGALCQKLYTELPTRNSAIFAGAPICTEILVRPSYVLIRVLSESNTLIAVGVATWDNETENFEEESSEAWSIAEKLYLDAARLKGNTRGMRMPSQPNADDYLDESDVTPAWVAIINILPSEVIKKEYTDLHEFIHYIALGFQLTRVCKNLSQEYVENKTSNPNKG